MAKKSANKKNVGKSLNLNRPNINLGNLSLKKLSNKQIIITGVAVGAILLGVSGYFWWTRVFTNSDRVFADMLANNLSSSSVSRTISQRDQSSSVNQSVYINFGAPEVMSQSRTVISERAGARTTTVTTESIGTSEADYVRYVSAEGAEELAVAGNLSKVLGVWGKRTPNTDLGEAPTFLNEAVFGIVPFGNLPAAQRTELLQFIDEKDLYKVSQSKRSFVDGRYIYSYGVSMDPSAFVEVLAKYVELSGIGDSSQLDPAAYEGSPPVALEMTVDILSRQLLSIEYLATGRIETIENRGLYRNVEFPNETIPLDELQQRLFGAANS